MIFQEAAKAFKSKQIERIDTDIATKDKAFLSFISPIDLSSISNMSVIMQSPCIYHYIYSRLLVNPQRYLTWCPFHPHYDVRRKTPRKSTCSQPIRDFHYTDFPATKILATPLDCPPYAAVGKPPGRFPSVPMGTSLDRSIMKFPNRCSFDHLATGILDFG